MLTARACIIPALTHEPVGFNMIYYEKAEFGQTRRAARGFFGYEGQLFEACSLVFSEE